LQTACDVRDMDSFGRGPAGITVALSVAAAADDSDVVCYRRTIDRGTRLEAILSRRTGLAGGTTMQAGGQRGGSKRSDRISSGISGFDAITGGGLPRGRVTVVLGGAGSGKTIFALQTLVTGARQGEPGLFITFEESAAQVLEDAKRFDWNAAEAREKGLAFLDAQVSHAVLQGGEFDLLGLLAVAGARAKQLACKRVVFDGLDVLLAHLGDPALVRREVFRIREWLSDTGMTGIVTAKADARTGQLSSDYDFLPFMSDCVISLQHRVTAGSAVRMLRVAKYRGNAHSANEFPFTITTSGIEVADGTAADLHHPVSTERVTSGVPRLDEMLRGGHYRGTSVLISGSPGTSKTSLAAAFAAAACARGEATVFVSFDEAPEQIIRNVASIGIDLARHVKSGVLTMCSLRARSNNPESHVARIRALVGVHHAKNLVVDPISSLAEAGDSALLDRAAIQVLDVAKGRGITTVSTSLLANAAPMSEATPVGISTIADTWIHVSYVSKAGERNRALTIVKARGTAHSNQVRELILSADGIALADPYMAGGEVLMGTLRWEREVEARRNKLLEVAEGELNQRQAELALAEARVRVEAARTEQALREAVLERLRLTGLAVKEADRVELAERTTLRGGESAPPSKPSSSRARQRGKL
jgi:circadian clock protein KaiC